MIFYHYTHVNALPGIAREGLWKGEVALTPRHTLNAVSLTTDICPAGHGLCDAGELTVDEKRCLGLDPNRVVMLPNKRAFRLRMNLLLSDRALVHWPKWGRKRLDPDWYDALSLAGGFKQRSWWLYWGVIPPEVTDLSTGQVVEGWPNSFREPLALAA